MRRFLPLCLLFLLLPGLPLLADDGDEEGEPTRPRSWMEDEVEEVPPYEETPSDGQRVEEPPVPDFDRKDTPAFRITFDWWFARLIDGEMQKQKNLSGDLLYLDHHLGLQGAENSGGPRIHLTFELTDWFSVRYRWFELTFRDHRQRLFESVQFDGTTYPKGAEISSKFRFDDHDLGFTFSTVDVPYFRLGIPCGFKWATGHLRMRDNETRIRTSDRVSSFFPYLGLEMAIVVPEAGVELYGRIAGFGVAVGDEIDNHVAAFFEAEAGFILKPSEHFHLRVGYQYYALDIEREKDDSDEELELEMVGLFAGAALRF